MYVSRDKDGDYLVMGDIYEVSLTIGDETESFVGTYVANTGNDNRWIMFNKLYGGSFGNNNISAGSSFMYIIMFMFDSGSVSYCNSWFSDSIQDGGDIGWKLVITKLIKT